MGATPPARAKELSPTSLTVDSGRRVRGHDFAGAGCRFLNMGIVATPVISDHKTHPAGYLHVLYNCNHEKLIMREAFHDDRVSPVVGGSV